MVNYYEARVLFDYTPAASDELRLREGELVEVRVDLEDLDRCEDGWLLGSDLQGQHGTFPANYVSDLRTTNNTSDVSSETPHALVAPPRIDDENTFAKDVQGENILATSAKLASSSNNQHENDPPVHTGTGDGRPLADDANRLPEGWFFATEQASGKAYYYTEDGRRSRTRPVQAEEDRLRKENAATRIQAARRGQRARKNTTIAHNQNRTNRNHETGLHQSAEEREVITVRGPPTAEKQDITFDAKTLGLIASVVDARLKEELFRRDAILSDIQVAVNALANDRAAQLEERRRVDDCDVSSQQLPRKPPSPVTPSKCTLSVETHVNGILDPVKEEPDGKDSRIRHSPGYSRTPHLTAVVIAPVNDQVAESTEGRCADDCETSPVRLRRKLPSPVTPSKRSTSANKHANGTMNLAKQKYNRRDSPSRHSLEYSHTSPPAPAPISSGSRRSFDDRTMARNEGSMSSLLPPYSQPTRTLPRGSASGLTLTRAIRNGENSAVYDPSLWTSRNAAADSTGAVVHAADASPDQVRGERGRQNVGNFGSCGRSGGTTIHTAPRVADVDGIQRLALARQRAKDAGKASLVKQARGRTAMYHPSWYDPERADIALPNSELTLEYVHGYAGETPRGIGGTGTAASGGGIGTCPAATKGTNVLWLHTGELVFPASGVVVMHDIKTNRQRFFVGHDEEVTALAVHPFEDIVASGQAGKEAIVCLFDASRRRDIGRPHADSRLTEETSGDGAGAPPLFLRELSLGKKEKRGVTALDFSPDGSLVVAMAGGEGQALSVWDWRRGARLASARAETSFLHANLARFNPWLFLEGAHAEAAGLPPGDACYTLVSCGQRHVKFWTLTRERLYAENVGDRESAGVGATAVAPAVGIYGDQGRIRSGNVDGGGRGWVWSLAGKPGSFRGRGEVDTMGCMAFIGEPWGGKEQWHRRRRRGEHYADDEASLLPIARTVTGADNGQIYFWEVAELRPTQAHPSTAATSVGGRRVGWKPHGRLLAVVPNAHEGPLTDMCYFPHRDRSHQEGVMTTGKPGIEGWGRLATCGGEGTVRLWGVVRLGQGGSSPLQLLLTVDISSKGIGIGHARSVSWDSFAATLAVGTAGNAVCLVQLKDEIGKAGNLSDATRKSATSVVFTLIVQSHTGSCKALAPHPTKPWFVTGGSDRVLRLWNAHSRRQLSAVRLLERVCSAAFHPTGDMLAVTNEAGDLLLMALKCPARTASDNCRQPPSNGLLSEDFSWEVFARKRMVHGGAAASNRALTRRELGSSPKSRGDGKYEIYCGGTTGTAALTNISGKKSCSALPTTDTLQSIHQGRQSNLSTSASGLDYNLRRGQSSRRRPNGNSRSPRSRDRFGGSSSTRAHREGETRAGTNDTEGEVSAFCSSTTMGVGVIRFSPDGNILAASSGSFIYLYREAWNKVGGSVAGGSSGAHEGSRAYRRYAVCTGHGNRVKSIDVSIDGLVLQSNDAGGELLFWEVSTGRQITNTLSIKDLEMDSWTSSTGWPVQGLATAAAAARGDTSGHSGHGPTGGIIAVCQSNAGDVMAMSDEENCVSLVRNPAPEGAEARASWGHTTVTGVRALTFLYDDQRLVSAGGACIFVWRHVRRRSKSGRRGPGDR